MTPGRTTRTADACLDCVRCGRWFTDFDLLAEHMHQRHRTPRSTPHVRRPPSVTKAVMNIPKPSGTGGTSGTFLKVGHIKTKGRTKIELTGTARAEKGQFGPQIIVAVKLGKTAYDWSFSQDGGNHTRLFKRFGANPKKWKGTVDVEIKEFNGNKYVAVAD